MKQYWQVGNKKIPYIAGGKGGCFAKDTIIATPTKGGIAIQNIKVRDLVLSYDAEGRLQIGSVSKLFKHDNQKLIRVYFWGGNYVDVTPNHWFLTEDNVFKEIGKFTIDEALININGNVLPIEKIIELPGLHSTYNFTVYKYHTYVANNIRVHNKGGGKGGATAAPGVEDPNSLFSTDILFLTTALGEGPVYRINPNGSQDIEINESAIDDLLNLDSDGGENTEVFLTNTRTGTLTQAVMSIFGEETVTPQNMSSAVTLKKGNISGIPASRVTLQDTSAGEFDIYRFYFNVNALQKLDEKGNIFAYSLKVRITLYDRTGTTTITTIDKEVNGKTNVSFRFSVDVIVPSGSKSESGHKFTVEKISDDSDSSKIQDSVSFIGWQEIDSDDRAYPRTALIGYALKAFGEYTGGVPTFTSLVKGLLCKVPSNYNQPTLSDGEIDWRELELPETGAFGYTTNGYRLQQSGATVKTDANPIIYSGLWDGSFVYSWTQNPVWILYDLLTNSTYGLGIPASRIDKFKFYKIAQYCDAVDPKTGKWYGVDGIADGTFRHKPLGQYTAVREKLIGINSGIKIKERRFTCDITIASQQQVIDIINLIAGNFRGIIYYSGGKISLNVDLPEELPVAIFNESNIEEGSLVISGIKESEIITGVDVTYIDVTNHYRRETIRIDDPEALKDTSGIENVQAVDLSGVTRRGQSIRFGQYVLASNKYIRRKVTFSTNQQGLNVTVGDVIAISQRQPGTSWGYGGRVAGNSSIGQSNVVLEHFTSPSISASVLTSNTLPLGLRVIKRNTDKVTLFAISNSTSAFNIIESGNTITGADLIDLNIIGTMDSTNKVFDYTASNGGAQFSSATVPIRGDTWTFGEIDPSDVYRSTNDKLFKVTAIERSEEQKITINASEYISNVYTDSDSLVSYEPVAYTDTFSPLITPPVPMLNVVPKAFRLADGSIRNDLEVSVSYDKAAYPLNLGIEMELASTEQSYVIESIN